MKKIAFVSGDSSGIGKELVDILKKDYIVYGISRKDIKDADYNHIACNILNYEKLETISKLIVEKHERIDLVIACAGNGVSGAIECLSQDDINLQLETNLNGVINIDKAFIPFMRKQGFGKIVHISSVASIAPIPFQSLYSASKAAINNYSLALANELRPYGIQVLTILPGDIKTGFTQNRKKIDDVDGLYGDRVTRSVSKMENDETNGQSPIFAAKKIINHCNKKNPKPLYVIGFSYQLLAFLIKMLPSRLVNWILYKMYAN